MAAARAARPGETAEFPQIGTGTASFRVVFAQLVTHYWSHGCFLADDQRFDHVDRLVDIPAVLIHGRYDVSGPLDTAWRLHRAWPKSQLVILDAAGPGGAGFTAALEAS
jgi:proline iminopeptidase